MIIVKLIGGLGNQMFQYAFGKAMSMRYGSDVAYDFDFFDRLKNGEDTTSTIREFELTIFKNTLVKSANISEKQKIIGNKFLNLLSYHFGFHRKNFYQENKFSYNERTENLSLPVYLCGYWQSFQYFDDFQEIIRSDFQFNLENLGDKNNEVLELITLNSSAVSIHVRRGDYLKSSYCVSNEDYYRSAIDIIKKKIKKPLFILFSDDPQWVRDKIVSLVENCILIDWNAKDDSWKDMMLMSNCSHHIIANSSFSWWGAWLGKNPDKIVIAPNKWFLDSSVVTSDLCPKNWIVI